MSELRKFSDDLAALVEGADRGVVGIRGARCTSASGIAWTNDLVVTTARGVPRDDEIEVLTADGPARASLVGSDGASDIAVLRVAAELRPFEPAKIDELRVGEIVLGLGRPEHALRPELGLVSALGEWRPPGRRERERYVETDLVASRGSAGGPLLDARGRLVGMRGGGRERGTFALSALTLARAVDELTRAGRQRGLQLGVGVQPVTLPETVGTPRAQRSGLIVLAVRSGAPAELAGVLLGDVLVALGGTPLERVEDLQAALREASSATPLPLEVLRAGLELRLDVTPAPRS